MLNVDIEKILPVTEARDSLNKIVEEVSSSDEMYVLTVNGKPNAVVVGVQHLEKLTGNSRDDLMAKAGIAAATGSQTDDATNAKIGNTSADDTANNLNTKPVESLPTDSTPSQPLVGQDASGTESPLPTMPAGENAAPTDTAQTTQPGQQQDPEAAVPLNGEPADASPMTTGQSITPETDPFATPGPNDIFEQTNSQSQNPPQSNGNQPTSNPPAV